MNEENIITIVDAITGETVVREMTPEEIEAAKIPAEPTDA